jgi:hypothetical protein
MSCPCKQKLTEEQKSLINGMMGKSFISNPNGDAAGSQRSELLTSYNTLSRLKDALTPVVVGGQGGQGGVSTLSNLGQALSSAGIGAGKLDEMMGKVSNLRDNLQTFKDQADRLSNPQTLMSTIGSMNFSASLGCALGIEGLDVNLSVGILTGNGGNAISISGGVNADLTRILSQFSDSAPLSTLEDAARTFNSQIENINSKISEAAGAVSDVASASINTIAKGAALISDYSKINFFSTLLGESNDPCNKLSAEIGSSDIITPQFKQLASAANSSVSGGGTSR